MDRFCSILILLLLCVTNVQCIFPFMNVSLSWKERVNDLTSRLTLTEMMNQMAKGRADTSTGAPAIPRLGIGQFDWATECLHGDAIAGNATSFPQAIGLAASWSKDLVYRVALAVSVEVRAKNNNYTKHGLHGFHQGLTCFSPVINILRDPRWGRSQETYGEDPYLTGELAANFVKGLQGDHPRYVRAAAGCKHFAAYAGPENIPESRMSFNARVTDRDLRTTFLPAFKRCVDAGTYSVMCSYNSINGVPACANKELLTDILRKDWGFEGYVVSDAGAIENVWHFHNYTSNDVDTVAATVNAGCNLNLAAGNWSNFTNAFYSMVDAVNQNKIQTETVLDRMKPLWYTRMRLGEFDPADSNPYRKLNLSVIQSDEHQTLSLEAAIKSFVLLKNLDNTLPLRQAPYHWIAIVGPMIDNAKQSFGDYSADIDPMFTVTPYYGLSSLGGNITSGAGCSDTKCINYSPNDIHSAVAFAEVVFVCIGLGVEIESEGRDRSNISLPGHQQTLVEDAIKFSPKTAKIILIVFNAGAVDLAWAEENERVSAIIAAFYPAQTTGVALKQFIINEGPHVTGGGARLPYTWPKSDDQLPPMTDYSMSGRTYRYLGSDHEPLYPFGYGLSYTEFSYQSVKVNLPFKDQVYMLKPGEDVRGSVTVLNIGVYDGDEVIQIYVKWLDAPVLTPNIQLVDFSREFITSNGKITYAFVLKAKDLAVWTENKGWVNEGCLLQVFIGGQQPFQSKSVGSNILNFKVQIQENTVSGGHQFVKKTMSYIRWLMTFLFNLFFV